MSKYDELFDAYEKSKAKQIATSNALRRAVGEVSQRLGQMLECPKGTYWSVDPEDPAAKGSVAFPDITLDEDELHYRIQLRLMLERKGHEHRMQFDVFILIDWDSVWKGEFIFSVPGNDKAFKINPDDRSQIDAFCQHVFEGVLAILQGREDWATSGNAGMGFYAVVLERNQD
jgi:hypothetical protein